MADNRDFGGEMRITVGGVPYTMRGTFTVNPSNRTVQPGASADGSVYTTHTMAGYRFEVALEDSGGLDPHALLTGGPFNVSVIEDSNGTLHMWTGCKFHGDPQINRQTGEVTGLSGVAPSYRRATA